MIRQASFFPSSTSSHIPHQPQVTIFPPHQPDNPPSKSPPQCFPPASSRANCAPRSSANSAAGPTPPAAARISRVPRTTLSTASERPSRTTPPRLAVCSLLSSWYHVPLTHNRRFVAQVVDLVRSPARKDARNECGNREGIEADMRNSVVIPALCIAGVNAWRLWDEHWEHVSHEPPVEERTEYPYMNIRTKNYFWGDGDKVSTDNIRCCCFIERWADRGIGMLTIFVRLSSGTRRSTITTRITSRSEIRRWEETMHRS